MVICTVNPFSCIIHASNPGPLIILKDNLITKKTSGVYGISLTHASLLKCLTNN